MSISPKPSNKSPKKAIEDMTQNILQLKLNLKSAHDDGDTKKVKDIERAIKLTQTVIDTIKRLNGYK